MSVSKLRAPFTAQQVKMFKEYQENPMFHPYTCTGCTPSKPLKIKEEGLYCEGCAHEQKWIFALPL